MAFNKIRKKLLDEAKASPNLLSDLAGLESYIGESYNNRSFIELLQNADDANATKFKILKKGNYLYVGNNGRKFNAEDLESLCRSASSNKVRGESIGYRGIGFKSVVGFAKEIHIISGDFEITFSKKKTAIEIPEATQVPLIRIPHCLEELDKAKFKSVLTEFKTNGYTTIFVFSGVTAHEIELEFNSFNSSSLLFLRNICETDINIGDVVKTIIEKTIFDKNISRVNIINENSKSSWLIISNHNISIAFHEEENEIKKLDETISLVYAFLPTEDASGFGGLINGYFSTDPSRKHLIYDEKTLLSVNACAKHILDLLDVNIRRNSDTNLGLVNALIPFMDPRMLQFKKPSFEKYLIKELKSIGNKMFSALLICPSWLNIKDYSLLANTNTAQVNHQCYNLEGFIPFAKYLGATEADLYSLRDRINGSQLSILGCSQITIQIFKGLISKSYESETWLAELQVLLVNNQRVSLEQLKYKTATIDKSFISLLIENGLTEFDIKQVLSKFTPTESIEMLFREAPNKNENLKENENIKPKRPRWFDAFQAKPFSASNSSIKRWRNAEENALEVLNSNGFKLTDVSKQNIGYDIEGLDPDGHEIQIEVKSITIAGQKFKLTNNEVAVAQEKKETYYIAVVRQLDDFIEIALISDPVKNLVLNRQCVQWVWECSDYNYNPIKFEI